ncbi:uncharacterized protein TrAFT101_000309 [Trichoderma asperellum]|uniref:uncharacterized protein n=1 Tax=Trichoderma asperellum TaxID=101201 RepID=UPI0033290210|nr:hypothetical protein TrAFT101_000309 [Trichoderma asperellum]
MELFTKWKILPSTTSGFFIIVSKIMFSEKMSRSLQDQKKIMSANIEKRARAAAFSSTAFTSFASSPIAPNPTPKPSSSLRNFKVG